MKQLELRVMKMGCQSCVVRVEQALEGVPGVRVDQVTPGHAKVAIDPARVDEATVLQAVSDAGYAANFVGEPDNASTS